VQAADREIARQTALRAKAVAAFAASRPSSADRAQGEPGATSADRWARRAEVLRPVSEWAAQELTVALSISLQTAEALLERCLTLVHRLPATLAALEVGALHPGHLWPLLDKVAPIADDALRAQPEADLLAWASERVTTPGQLGDKARRELLKRNARSAADDLARAVRERGIGVRPDRTDGMSVVSALLTTPEACALVGALGAYADALPADPVDTRSRGQKMADCLLDLVLRPGETGLPPVHVTLTVVAPVAALLGGDAPCEVDGQVVPAEVVRALLTALTGQSLVTTSDATPTDTTPTDVPSAGAAPEDTAPEDTAPSDATSASVDATPEVDRAGATAARALLAEEDFLRWSKELECRILTDEVEPDPLDAVPEDELLRWLAHAGPPPGDGGDDPAPGLDPPPVPDRLPRPDASCPGEGPAEPDPGDGWWARADRAVHDAGTALPSAQRAVGYARRLVDTAGRADGADEAAWAAGPGGRVTAATDTLTALAAATDAHRQALAGLLAATGGGGLADRPRIALTDALTGALLSLTDLPELRRTAGCGEAACRRTQVCPHDLIGRPGLGAPGPTDGYRPATALDRHLRARDRRCRFPGCRRRVPRGGELDHVVPYPAGPTSATNLAGFCTGHHRGKHQAPGWHHQLAADGTLTVTTPTGLVTMTTPPPF
jgi:hypothetical protein